jgi:hypothetical protein
MIDYLQIDNLDLSAINNENNNLNEIMYKLIQDLIAFHGSDQNAFSKLD